MFTIRRRELSLSRENYDTATTNGAMLFSLLTNSIVRMQNVNSSSIQFKKDHFIDIHWRMQGGARNAPPSQNSLIFMQFSAKN